MPLPETRQKDLCDTACARRKSGKPEYRSNDGNDEKYMA